MGPASARLEVTADGYVDDRLDSSKRMSSFKRSNEQFELERPGFSSRGCTGSSSVLQYLLKPVTETISESLGER